MGLACMCERSEMNPRYIRRLVLVLDFISHMAQNLEDRMLVCPCVDKDSNIQIEESSVDYRQE